MSPLLALLIALILGAMLLILCLAGTMMLIGAWLERRDKRREAARQLAGYDERVAAQNGRPYTEAVTMRATRRS